MEEVLGLDEAGLGGVVEAAVAHPRAGATCQPHRRRQRAVRALPVAGRDEHLGQPGVGLDLPVDVVRAPDEAPVHVGRLGVAPRRGLRAADEEGDLVRLRVLIEAGEELLSVGHGAVVVTRGHAEQRRVVERVGRLLALREVLAVGLVEARRVGELRDRLVHLGAGPGAARADLGARVMGDQLIVGARRAAEVARLLVLDARVEVGLWRALVVRELLRRPEVGLGGLGVLAAARELLAGREHRLQDQRVEAPLALLGLERRRALQAPRPRFDVLVVVRAVEAVEDQLARGDRVGAVREALEELAEETDGRIGRICRS